jgi:hypothetical protein
MELPAGCLALANSMPSVSWTAPNFKPPRNLASANARTSAMLNTICTLALLSCVAAALCSAIVQPPEGPSPDRSIRPSVPTAHASQSDVYENQPPFEHLARKEWRGSQRGGIDAGSDMPDIQPHLRIAAFARCAGYRFCCTKFEREYPHRARSISREIRHHAHSFPRGSFSRRHPEFPPNWHSSRTTCCAPWNIAARLRFTHWRSRMIITPGRPMRQRQLASLVGWN